MPNFLSDLIAIQPGTAQPPQPKSRSILLLRAPYFTPWTPPLGIGILKAFLNSRGHKARCFDFNADPELWGMHHRYFSILAASADGGTNDGYSRLWWIINAHMLAYANGAAPAAQRRVIESISPLYGVRITRAAADALLPLIDRYFTRLTHMFDQLDLSGYDVIGTSTYTTSLSSSLWLLERAKRKRPEVTTIMGGGVFADDLALGSENLQILLEQYPSIDHVILGEGELLLQKLLDGDLAHKRVLSLPDLAGATLKMEDVPAPDFSDFDLSRYYNLTIEGARSCPFQCSFCSETIQWGEYRKKPIDKLVSQVIGMADTLGMREVFLGDSLMNPYLIPFAESLMKQNGNILYDGYLRADRPVTHDKFVKPWADSGLYRVRLGVESGSERVLKSMAKMTTPAVISDVLKTLSKAGIRTTTYWIVGYSGETEADFQETCDFIRAHHQYIYELEAHPYYYYPYGQVGSRLHQCESAYPEEVTNHTRFKVWEIIDSDPPREVRYQRLDRISQLAAELGLPNIYTMTERYDAEDRWRALHPFAREVFKNADRVAATEMGSADLLIADPFPDSPVIRYRLSVSKTLDGAVLESALATVRAHYPALHNAAALQVELQNGEAGASIALSAKHAVADGPTLALAAEALCRAYEQIAGGRSVFHRPEEKPFAEFARGHHAVNAVASDSAPSLPVEQIALSDAASSGIWPEGDGRRKAHIRFLTAAFTVLRRSGIRHIAVLLDARAVDRSLGYTAGPISCLVEWPDITSMPTDACEAVEWVSGYFEKAAGSHAPKAAKTLEAVIDLEYLTDLAWMGSPEWRAEGFEGALPAAPASRLEIRPVVTPQGSVLHLRCAEALSGASLAGQLEAELILVSSESEALERAELFWREELGYAGETVAPLPSSRSATFETVEINAVKSPLFDRTSALVALYSLLAPRLDGVSVSRIALLERSRGSVTPTPIRMHESGNPNCLDFIRAAQEKIDAARPHAPWSDLICRRMEDNSFAAHAGLMSAAGPDDLASCHTVLDLSCVATPRVLFRNHLYRREQIENLTGAIESVLAQLANDQQLRIGDVLWGNIEPSSTDETEAVAELSHEFQFGD